MNPLDLALWILQAVFLKHIVLLLIPAAITFALFFPAEALAFVRTTAGKIVIAAVVAIGLGWEARGWVDGADDLRTTLSAKVTAAELARTAAVARAADERRQALAQRAVAMAAATRASAAQAEADANAEAAAAYEDRSEAAERRAAKGRPPRFALSPADAAALERFRAPRK